MAVLRWTPNFGYRRPFSDLHRMRRNMESFFNTFGGLADQDETASAGVYPLLNMGEDDENVYVTAELAGVSPEDLEISVHNENLVIRGERKIAEAEQNVNYHRRERKAGIFRRVVSLPVRVDGDKVQAKVKNGILSVILPKASEAKPRQIAIQAG